jgi:TorA maturation chaperone TorD
VRKSVELADIAAFYRAFNLGVDAADPELVDHISLELDFLAEVGFKQRYAALQGWREQAEICQKAYRNFWEEHLGRWSPGFLENLQQLAPEGSFYQVLAQVALAFILQELHQLGITPGHLQPDRSEIPAYECLGCVEPQQGEEAHAF